MRKVYASISFLFILFVPIIGSYGWLCYKEYQIERKVEAQIKEDIEEERLVILKFTLKQTQTLLRWEHAMEFEYQGQMYDVIESQTVGDSIYYKCWWDVEETKVKQQLAELKQQSPYRDAEKQKVQQQLAQFFKSLFIQQYHPLLACFSFYQTIKAARTNHYRSLCFQPPFPPPRV